MVLPSLILQSEYVAQRIPLPPWPGSAWARVYIGGLRILEDGTVAGYRCSPAGPHGDTFNAVPFVARDGKYWPLPLGGRAYGHVYVAAGGKLAGDVVAEHEKRGFVMSPATWERDPKLGWAEAKLTVLPKGEEGWVVAISPQGEIWATGDKGLRRLAGNRWIARKTDRFDLEGVDARGRLWGNRYRSLGEGFSRIDPEGGAYEGDRWVPFPEKATVSDVDAAGNVAGNVEDAAVRWFKGRLDHLSAGKPPAEPCRSAPTARWSARSEAAPRSGRTEGRSIFRATCPAHNTRRRSRSTARVRSR